FGLPAALPARLVSRARFRGRRARALLPGISAHAMTPLDELTSTGIGLLLALLGHAVGWPIARGGSQKIVDALAAYLRTLGGDIITGYEVTSLDTLPTAQVILCDITPRQLLRI